MRASKAGFTLLELLVATAVFVIILMIGITVLGQASNTWRRSAENAGAFQSARTGFDLITRNLSQATLNTFVDYVDAGNRFPGEAGYDNAPVRYARQSDLHFVCAQAGASGTPGTAGTGSAVFFEFPQGQTNKVSQYGGLDGTLNACGYYVEFGADSGQPAHVQGAPKYRYRLKELLVPTEENAIFKASTAGSNKWFADFASTRSYPVAENIIALILRPEDPADPSLLAGSYTYDSRLNTHLDPQPLAANQMPPVVQVTMIAIDEPSAQRLADGATPPAVIVSALKGRLQEPAQLETDLTLITKDLAEARINYRVFSTAIPIRESKWTK